MVAVLAIMIILLAVLALIVVNALRASPWGLFTIACTIPIALLMGWWMKRWRPGKVEKRHHRRAVVADRAGRRGPRREPSRARGGLHAERHVDQR